MAKLIIGLTGGIGSGKTQAAQYFHELGVEIIDADVIARDVVADGSPAFTAITKRFGTLMLNANGALDREKLRTHIFQHPEARKWIENLLHPLIREKMVLLAKRAQSPYCIMVIPLLIENLPHPLVDRILVIDCEEAQQKNRGITRDQTTQPDIEAIIKTQASRQQRLAEADDIIKNDRDLAHLKTQVQEMHNAYLALCEDQV